jgi:hypothetical protein
MQPPPAGQWYASPPRAPDPRLQDDEHLKLLVVFHYVMSVLIALFSLIPLIYVGMGALMLNGGGFMTTPSSGPPPPAFVGWFLIALGGAVMVVGETFAVLTLVAARSLAARRNWLLCVVVACFNTLHAPLGTALGVFTLIVLLRPSVKTAFQVT